MVTLVAFIKAKGHVVSYFVLLGPMKSAITWMVKENSVECLQYNAKLG